MAAPKARKILVAVDGSDVSKRALEYGISLARPEDTIVALHVESKFQEEVEGPLPSDVLVSLEKELDKRGGNILKECQDKAEKHGVNYNGLLVKGDPRTEIVDIADKEQADMVVVGNRGRSALKRMLLGSVSEFVVHNSPCPVLVVRDHQK